MSKECFSARWSHYSSWTWKEIENYNTLMSLISDEEAAIKATFRAMYSATNNEEINLCVVTPWNWKLVLPKIISLYTSERFGRKISSMTEKAWQWKPKQTRFTGKMQLTRDFFPTAMKGE